MCRGVVKRSEVLAGIDAEAGLPYEETALAKRAGPARRRLALVLLLGAGGLLLEAVVAREPLWALAAAAVALAAGGVRRRRLGGLVAAGLVAILATLLPLRFLVVGLPDALGVVTGAVSVAFGLAMLPDVVLLVRDAELQHAYGLWARREAPR